MLKVAQKTARDFPLFILSSADQIYVSYIHNNLHFMTYIEHFVLSNKRKNHRTRGEEASEAWGYQTPEVLTTCTRGCSGNEHGGLNGECRKGT